MNVADRGGDGESENDNWVVVFRGGLRQRRNWSFQHQL